MRSPTQFLGKRSFAVEEYEKVNFLGQGGCGQVIKAVHVRTGWERAIKIIPKAKETEPVRCEAMLQKSLDHPNIVKIFEQFEDATHTYLVMELCEGGNLREALHHWVMLSESDVGFIMRQVFCALRYLHRVGVRHSDIVLENILLAQVSEPCQSIVKLADFGAAMRTREVREDLAACGRIMQMLLGSIKGRYQQPTGYTVPNATGVDVAVSKGAKALVDCLLDVDQNFSAGEALSHVWMKKSIPRNDAIFPKSFVDKLWAFQSHNKFKRFALQVIADHLGRDQENQIRQLFLRLNSNCDGLLTQYEIKKGMQKAKLEIPAELHKLLKQVDGDGIGVLDFTTFLAVFLDEESYRKREACLSAFSIFDRGGKGFATQDDIAEVLWGRDANFNIISGPVDHLVKLVDTDGDGNVSFGEFFAMMCSNSPVRSSLRRKERKATLKGFWSPEKRFVQAAKYRARELTRHRNQKLNKNLKARAERLRVKKAARAASSVEVGVDDDDIAHLSDFADSCASSVSEESEVLLEDGDTYGDGDAFRDVLQNAFRHGMGESGFGEFITSSFASYSNGSHPIDVSFRAVLRGCMEDSDGLQEFMPEASDTVCNAVASSRDVSTAGVNKVDETHDVGLFDLSHMRTGQLVRHACAHGATQSEIDDALDEGNPKAAIIDLIISKKINKPLADINVDINRKDFFAMLELETKSLEQDAELDKVASAGVVANACTTSDCQLAMQYCSRLSPCCPLLCEMCGVVHL